MKADASPLILGITGGIACGKSYISSLFQELGATLISADQLAREVVLPGSPTLTRIVERFGSKILTPNGSLDRESLAREVFANPSSREDLNQIMHPAIAMLAEARLRQHVHDTMSPLVVYEAPLLYEAHAEHRVDLVLVVSVASKVQLQRLMQRDKLNRKQAENRISAQMPLKEKIRLADILIDNTSHPKYAESAVRRIFATLTQKNPP